MWNRNSRFFAFACAAAILLGAAASAAEPAEEFDSPFDSRIGWFYECLAIKNHALEPGTPLTLMILDPDRTEFVAYGTYTHRVAGRIIGKTRSGERCRALDSGYRDVNDSPDISFYEVSLEGGLDPEFTNGMAVLGLEAQTEMIDLNGDGAEDSFTLCHTGEGFRFEMWSGEARKSERLWRGNFHFGHEVSSGNCETGPVFVPVLGPFDLQVGYVDECLAIKNGGIEPGTPVTIMAIDDGEKFAVDRILTLRLTGRILGKTTSDQNCPPLFDNRRGVNDSDGVSFYTIALDDGPFMDPDETIFGIGLVGLGPENSDPIDFDGNGAPDIFTACQFSESFRFVIWGRTPYSGKPLWETHSYLGFEVEGTDCPTTDEEPNLSAPPSAWWPLYRVGWLHGCFAIDNTQLQPGTPVGLMLFVPEDERKPGRGILKRWVAGTILARTQSAEGCPPLAEDVRYWNEQSVLAFYRVALEDGQSVAPDALGIGIVRPEPGEDQFDLDRDGMPDTLSICGTELALGYAVWQGEPYESEVLWATFPLLKHEKEGLLECPEDFNF